LYANQIKGFSQILDFYLQFDEVVMDMGKMLEKTCYDGKQYIIYSYSLDCYENFDDMLINVTQIQIPSEILASVSSRTRLLVKGLIPDISCAYVVINSTLYLWKYAQLRLADPVSKEKFYS